MILPPDREINLSVTVLIHDRKLCEPCVENYYLGGVDNISIQVGFRTQRGENRTNVSKNDVSTDMLLSQSRVHEFSKTSLESCSKLNIRKTCFQHLTLNHLKL